MRNIIRVFENSIPFLAWVVWQMLRTPLKTITLQGFRFNGIFHTAQPCWLHNRWRALQYNCSGCLWVLMRNVLKTSAIILFLKCSAHPSSGRAFCLQIKGELDWGRNAKTFPSVHLNNFFYIFPIIRIFLSTSHNLESPGKGNLTEEISGSG